MPHIMVQRHANSSVYCPQISCIPGGKFLGEVFSKQRHAPAFHLQLTDINEHWPGLAIAVPNADPPFYEFWQTVNVPLVVGHLLSCMQHHNAGQQRDAALHSVQRDRRAEHAC